jgi:N-acetyl-gamma-glutamyl-phosphate reductase
MDVYSHTNHVGGPSDPSSLEPAPGEGPRTPVSVGLEAPAGVATDRPTGLPRSARGVPAGGGPRRIRVAIVGATGYVGAELIRILARHPNVELVGLQGRDRANEPIEDTHRHLLGTGLTVDSALPEADAVFLALPHGTAATRVPDIARDGTAVIDLGPDFRLRDPDDYPRWYGFEHPHPELATEATYGLPELHRAELESLVDAPLAIVGAPGCYPTATLLALAPLARAGLIGDLVVDAKSGVSGAGREAKLEMMFGEVNESV